jgi:RND family efflux transporter MFP subunit
MAGKEAGSVRKIVRPIVLLLVLGGGGFAIWQYQHRSEGYKGGDVATTGTVEAEHVDLSFKVPGRIADVPVNEGDTVVPGQLVARLEPQDLEVQVSSAEAALLSARAGLAAAVANRNKAARDLARQRELLAGDATTPQAVDAARSTYEVARAQVASAEAQIRQAQSSMVQARLQRSYADLHAQESGQVSERIHLAGEMVMAGSPVVSIAELDTVKVHAAVDETRVGAVRPGDKVTVRVYTFDKKLFEGEVSQIEPAGDFATRKDWGAKRRDIRTFTVTARLPNPDHLLKDGMTADVTIHVSPGVAQAAGAGR